MSCCLLTRDAPATALPDCIKFWHGGQTAGPLCMGKRTVHTPPSEGLSAIETPEKAIKAEPSEFAKVHVLPFCADNVTQALIERKSYLVT